LKAAWTKENVKTGRKGDIPPGAISGNVKVRGRKARDILKSLRRGQPCFRVR